jgi:anti-anti-sigma factor
VLEHEAADGRVVVAVEGEIDLATADLLARPLAAICRRTDAVTVDLRRVAFLDCVGLRVLLEARAEARAHGCRVEFVQGPDPVARVFELTGTAQQLDFVGGATPPAAAAGA